MRANADLTGEHILKRGQFQVMATENTCERLMSCNFRSEPCFLSMCVTELMSSDCSMQLGVTVYVPSNNYYRQFILYFNEIILPSR